MQTIDMHRSWGGGGGSPPRWKNHKFKNIFRALYDIASIYGNGLWWFGRCLGGLGCFNGPHDGYANSKVAGQIDAYFVKLSLQSYRFKHSFAL